MDYVRSDMFHWTACSSLDFTFCQEVLKIVLVHISFGEFVKPHGLKRGLIPICHKLKLFQNFSVFWHSLGLAVVLIRI